MLARRGPGQANRGPRIRCLSVRFGRRLALFFLLLAIVPTAALIAILLFVSSDSQQGKADARLAAGLQTAVAVYGGRTDGRHGGRQAPRARPGTGRGAECGRPISGSCVRPQRRA